MASLNALDLDSLNLKNIDPGVARRMLDEIQKGADVKSTLEKFNVIESDEMSTSARRRISLVDGQKTGKMVTFDDVPRINKVDDVSDSAL